MSCLPSRPRPLAMLAVCVALAACGKRPIGEGDDRHPDGGGAGDVGTGGSGSPVGAAGSGGSSAPVGGAGSGGNAGSGGGPGSSPANPTKMLVGFQLENDYCGLKADGQLRCWSDQDFFTNQLAPIVAKAPPGLAQIAVNETIQEDVLFCGVDGQGRGTCWGAKSQMDMGGGLASLVLSRFGVCALHQDGHVDCPYGGLQPSSLAGHRYVQIAAADDFIIGLDDTGMPIYSSNAPQVPAGTYRRVATIGGTGAALRDDGALVELTFPPAVMPGAFVAMWFDPHRLCGIDGAGTVTCFPADGGVRAPLSPPAGPFIQIAGGDNTMCGLRPTGTTTCWGDVTVAVPDGW